jgi:lipid II:glycine glycyltransferase (peptidoglycan interpeptide bridge formation enzyme)
MDVVVATPDDRERFDAWVSASPLADVLQSYEWGAVKQATGWDALRLMVVDGARIRGACSILRRRFVRGVPPLLYAPRGPVVDPSDSETLHALLEGMRAHAGGAFLFKCDPPIEAGSEAVAALCATGLRSVRGGPFGGVQPRAVMVLDLASDTDKIFEGFHKKWRYNIRLAERKGVVVREGARADLGLFHPLYLETARRDGFVGRGRGYFETLWNVLEPRGMLKLFVAEHEGVTLSAIILFLMGERAMYVYGASSSERRNLMPNHLAQWTAIRWAATTGYRLYDFRGVSPVRDGRPLEPHIAGLNRFKEGFGARYVEYAGEFDLPLRPLWYTAWRRALPVALAARRRLRGDGGMEPAD